MLVSLCVDFKFRNKAMECNEFVKGENREDLSAPLHQNDEAVSALSQCNMWICLRYPSSSYPRGLTFPWCWDTACQLSSITGTGTCYCCKKRVLRIKYGCDKIWVKSQHKRDLPALHYIDGSSYRKTEPLTAFFFSMVFSSGLNHPSALVPNQAFNGL